MNTLPNKSVETHEPLIPVNTVEKVKQVLESGETPLLGFEVDELLKKHDIHLEEQRALGKSLGDAMQQSSETWHDNAPAEAVTQQSQGLAERAKAIIHHMLHGEKIQYPAHDYGHITLGSVVDVQYEGMSDTLHCLVTGAVRELPDNLAVVVGKDTECVTVTSPIGSALLGAVEGAECEFIAGKGKHIKVRVAKILQLSEDIIEK